MLQGEVFEPPPEDVKPSVSSSPSTSVGLSVPTTSSSVAASVETKDVKKELEDSSRMSNVTVKSENKLEEKRPPLPSMKSEFDIENNIKFEQQNEPGQDFYQGGDHNEGDYHEHDSGQFQAQNEQFQSGQFYRQGGGQFQDQGQSNRFSVQDGGQFSDRQMDRDRNQRGPRGRGGGRGRGRGRGQDWEQQDNSSNTRMPAQGRGFRGQNNENNRFERDRSQDRRRYQDPNESWNQDVSLFDTFIVTALSQASQQLPDYQICQAKFSVSTGSDVWQSGTTYSIYHLFIVNSIRQIFAWSDRKC